MKRRARKTPGRRPKGRIARLPVSLSDSCVTSLSNSWCPRRPIVPANEELAAASTNPHIRLSLTTPPEPSIASQKCAPSVACRPRPATRRRRRTDRLPQVRTIGLPIGLLIGFPTGPPTPLATKRAEAAYPIPNAAYTPAGRRRGGWRRSLPSPFFVLLLLFPAAPSTRAPS
ncbi:hypothetical protein B0H13DRAFT_2515831 [Mycena leptocephala]|nr:hypothetical protein B0H13DRAFT_2515831 [Mycena leptocephala]